MVTYLTTAMTFVHNSGINYYCKLRILVHAILKVYLVASVCLLFKEGF